MSEIERELDSQPTLWRLAARRAGEEAGLLPARGERVAVVGCGTSLFVGQAWAAMREDAGMGETDAFAASEMPAGRSYDRVLAISRSGTTTEVTRLLDSLRPATETVAITATAGTPIEQAAGGVVFLDAADERSVVQTRFATTALALLRAHLGASIEPAARDAEAALLGELPADPRGFEHFVFLGARWTVGLANEAALKLREAAGAWAESYPAMEYRHGPISVAGSRSLVWGLGGVEAELLADVGRTGATVVAGDLDPMAELVRIQRVAVALALARGLDPDNPRHLTRSVVLS